MLEDAEETPLFPIAEFASHLAKMTGGLGTTYERALEFYKADDLLRAVRDLHRIQVRWFTGDSMVRFQQASFMLANSYLELGAAYVAKYVAFAAAHLARTSEYLEVASTAPKMLFLAADAEDGAGNSVSYLHLLLLAMLAHFEQDPDPLDQKKHPEVEKQLGQAAALRGFAARSGPSQLAVVDRALSIWPAPFRESVVRASLDPDGFWTKGTWDEAWSTMEQSFLDRPFGDLGGARTIGWRALGIHWTIGFINDVRTVAVAEEFAASLQMALVSLAAHDFCLLPMRVHLNVSLSEKPRITVDESKTGDGVMTLELAIRRESHGKDLARWSSETLAPIARMLELLSVLRAAAAIRSSPPKPVPDRDICERKHCNASRSGTRRAPPAADSLPAGSWLIPSGASS